MKTLEELRGVSDVELVDGLDALAVRDRETSAAIVAHLLVVKERSIHLDAGYPSIVEYCVGRLGCSRDMAYKRSAAVKVAEAKPEVIEWLASGEATLSGLAVLAAHRDEGDLVDQARGRSRREIERMVAGAHPDQVWNRFQSRVRPVAEGLCKLEITLPEELVAVIEEALDLDSHIDPTRDKAALLGRALGFYVEKRKRERLKEARRPRPAPAKPTKVVPAALVRAAFAKAEGRCEYVAADGKRCSATSFLEIDHVTPRALGGGHRQVRVLCRNHNQRAAELALGEERMAQARDRARLKRDLRSAMSELGFEAKAATAAAAGALEELGAGPKSRC